MVSLAYQVVVLSDAVAPVFGADRVKAEDAPTDVQCSTWNKAIVGFVEIAGLAFAVFGSPSRNAVEGTRCYYRRRGSRRVRLPVEFSCCSLAKKRSCNKR